MAYRSSLKFGPRRKSVFLMIMITLTIMGVIGTCGLLAGHVYMASHVKANASHIETIKQDAVALETQAEEIKQQEAAYQAQLNNLNQELARYEPVIIPDSMKTN